MVDIKTQELTMFVFILPDSVCHSFSPPPPPPPFFHCALHSGIVHKFAPQELVLDYNACQPTGSPEDYVQEEGEGVE